MGKEGIDVARWLNARGTAAFVLKYRLLPMPADHDAFRAEVARRRQSGTYQEEIRAVRARFNALSIADGQQAVRLVRQRAAEWGVAPDRLGIMGFSAGGTVAGGAALGYDEASRPSFAAPVYGAPPVTSPVPPDAPPLFIAVAHDDTRAADSCVALYRAWKTANRPAELHVYARGGHGFGLKQQGTTSDRWIDHFAAWLTAEGFLR
jgi:acetyl esterase/lipase